MRFAPLTKVTHVLSCICVGCLQIYGDSLRRYAIESLVTGTIIQRGVVNSSGSGGNSVILAPSTQYRAWLFEPSTGLIGFRDFFTPAIGQPGSIPQVRLGLAYSPDSDGDGLSDDAEFVVGTDPKKYDTFGLGISDGLLVRSGSDVLGLLKTGAVAQIGTGGTAIDVAAFDDVVAVATADRGVTLFNVFNRMPPVIIAQVTTFGSAIAVAGAGKFAAVADGNAGLTVVDFSDPPAAHAYGTRLGGFVQAVAVSGDIAFAGTREGVLSMVDIHSGILLNTLSFGERIEDLVVVGSKLYAYTASKLKVLSVDPLSMAVLGETPSSVGEGFHVDIGRGRLFVANGLAFLTHLSGYNTFDVSDPKAPTFLHSMNSDTRRLRWKQVQMSDRQLLLATSEDRVGVDGGNHIRRYTLKSPQEDALFENEIDSIGDGRSFAIYNGLAYLAASEFGLEAINYRELDTLGVPPSGSFSVSGVTNTVTTGQVVFLEANAADDVQVRNVEFYANGTRIGTDGNLPFSAGWRVPAALAGGKVRFTAMASDTGGNHAALDGVYEFRVLPDTVPPTVSIGGPIASGLLIQGDLLVVELNGQDDHGIDHYEFFVDDRATLASRIELNGWAMDILLPRGRHTLRVVAVDYSGNRSRNEVVEFKVQSQMISREISAFGGPATPLAFSASREVSAFADLSEKGAFAVSKELSAQSQLDNPGMNSMPKTSTQVGTRIRTNKVDVFQKSLLHR